MRFLRVVALTLVVVGPSAALATGGPSEVNIRAPLLLRLEGQLATSRPAAQRSGFTTASFGFLGNDAASDRWLGVTDARTVGGDRFPLGKDVLDALSPFTPNLLVTGPPALVDTLRDAPPNAAVRVEGIVDRGSRIYYLRSVWVGRDG
jgi:hypothetical protein